MGVILKMVRLDGTTSNTSASDLFDVLEDWNSCIKAEGIDFKTLQTQVESASATRVFEAEAEAETQSNQKPRSRRQVRSPSP